MFVVEKEKVFGEAKEEWCEVLLVRVGVVTFVVSVSAEDDLYMEAESSRLCRVLVCFMVEVKIIVLYFYFIVDVDAESLFCLCEEINFIGLETPKFSVIDLLVRVCVFIL